MGLGEGKKGELTPAENGVEDLPTTVSRSRTSLYEDISRYTSFESSERSLIFLR